MRSLTSSLGSDPDGHTVYAELQRGESVVEKQVKEAKVKCRSIASLLTDAPDPHSKGVLMFKKRRQRAKKYTLTCFGRAEGESQGDTEGETGGEEEEEGGSSFRSGSEVDEEGFSAAFDPTWDSGYLDMLDRRSSACPSHPQANHSPEMDTTYQGSGPEVSAYQSPAQLDGSAYQGSGLDSSSGKQPVSVYPVQNHSPVCPPAMGLANGVSVAVSRASVVLTPPSHTPFPTQLDPNLNPNQLTPLLNPHLNLEPNMNTNPNPGSSLNRTARPFTPGLAPSRPPATPVMFRPPQPTPAVSMVTKPAAAVSMVSIPTPRPPAGSEARRAVSSTSLYISPRPNTSARSPPPSVLSPPSVLFSPPSSLASAPFSPSGSTPFSPSSSAPFSPSFAPPLPPSPAVAASQPFSPPPTHTQPFHPPLNHAFSPPSSMSATPFSPPSHPAQPQFLPSHPAQPQFLPPHPTQSQYNPPNSTQSQYNPPHPTQPQYTPAHPAESQYPPPQPTQSQYPTPHLVESQYPTPHLVESQYNPPHPQATPQTPDSLASREQRISVPASRTGILQEARRRANKKPMFSPAVEDKKDVSPNPALLSLLHSLDSQPGTGPGGESGPEEDWLRLGAEACNFMQAQRGPRPPPVAPKPQAQAPQVPQLGGKGGQLFARRQSRMDRYMVERTPSTPPSHALLREPSPTPSLPATWKYSSSIRAGPPISYNPLLSPSCPLQAQKQKAGVQKGAPAGKKGGAGGKKGGIKAVDIMSHQPYQLNSSLFTYGGGTPQTTSAYQQQHSMTGGSQGPMKTARVCEVRRFSTPPPTGLAPKVIVPRSATTLGEPIWRSDVISPPPTPAAAPYQPYQPPPQPANTLYQPHPQWAPSPFSPPHPPAPTAPLPQLPVLTSAPVPNSVPIPAPSFSSPHHLDPLQAKRQFKSAPDLSPLSQTPPRHPSSITQQARVPRPRFSTSNLGLQPHVWRPGSTMH